MSPRIRKMRLESHVDPTRSRASRRRTRNLALARLLKTSFAGMDLLHPLP